MRRNRRLAFLFLIVAMVVILGMGFYLGATHQAGHPPSQRRVEKRVQAATS